ncbi:dihydroorotate dehydrogenase electron transfer subunit [bacterium]|nr:dihydroorotate dehydrogenase electron transfer subunit [bacterium]
MGCSICTVISNKPVAEGLYLMSVEAPGICSTALPGQFVHVRTGDVIDPLLRRPLCINRIDSGNGTLDLLYRVVGRGTAALAGKKPRDPLDVLGPLGNGFTVRGNFRNALVIAGGMGIAPMFFLIDELIRTEKYVTLLWGARTAAELFVSSADFAPGGLTLHTATEDGKAGHAGYVTDLLASILEQLSDAGSARAYTCGPVPMLKTVQKIMSGRGIPVEASLEERMACGIGVCAGCSVNTVQGKKLVCKDGPVMNLMEIVYDE